MASKTIWKKKEIFSSERRKNGLGLLNSTSARFKDLYFIMQIVTWGALGGKEVNSSWAAYLVSYSQDMVGH